MASAIQQLGCRRANGGAGAFPACCRDRRRASQAQVTLQAEPICRFSPFRHMVIHNMGLHGPWRFMSFLVSAKSVFCHCRD
jgi:hypothetical protein